MNKKSLPAILLCAAVAVAAKLPVAAATSYYLNPYGCFYLDGARVWTNGTAGVVSPSGTTHVQFASGTNYVFTATPPAGHRVDGWRLSTQADVTMAASLENLKSLDEYAGAIADVKWRTAYGNPSSPFLFLAPCFSWLDWSLSYKGNWSGIAGDYGVIDLVYTNSVTLASPSSLWPNAKRTGYEIVGWSLSATGEAEFSAGQVLSNAGEKLGAAADGDRVVLYAVWSKRRMTIALDAQGGSVASNSVVARIEEKYSLPVPSRQGFTFVNWYTAPSGVGSSIIDGQTVTRDDIEKLYARWELLEYTLSYDWNYAGAGTAPTGGRQGYTNTLVLAAAPSTDDARRTGYDLVGWATDSNTATAMFTAGETLKMSGSALNVTKHNQSVTLYGIWRKRQMKIALDAQGGTVSADTVTALIGEEYELPTPTRPGFRFVGWFTRSDGGDAIASGDTVATDKISTLYARWEALAFTLAYDENAAKSQRRDYVECLWTNEQEIASLPGSWTRKGWDFLGWAREKAATAADFEKGGKVANIGEALGVATEGVTNTLYAVWQARQMEIELDIEGNEPYTDGEAAVAGTEESAPDAVTAHVEGFYDLPELVRRDAWFKGWWTDASGGDEITNRMEVVRDDIARLYARWEMKQKFSVAMTYRDATGAETNDVRTVYELDMPQAPDEAAYSSWTGHTFLRWEPETWEAVTNDIAIAAIYKTNEYDVVFFANGGQGRMEPQHFVFDIGKKLSSNSFTRGKTGAWAFAGWARDEAAESPDYKDKELVINLATNDGAKVELNAVWTNALTQYSLAVGTDIVLSVADGAKWVVTNDVEVAGDSMLASLDADDDEGALMTGGVTGSGVLSFSWRADVCTSGTSWGEPTFSYKIGDDTEKLPLTNEWQFVSMPVASGDTPLEWATKSLHDGHHVLLKDIRWEPEGQLKVAFDGAGGTGAMEPVAFYLGEYGTLPRNAFSLVGHRFGGWLYAEAGLEFGDRACTNAITNATTLVAQWLPNEYSLRFLPGGGVGEMPGQPMIYGVEAAVSSNVFTRTGYGFAGWLFDGATFADGQTVSNLTATADETIDFTAQWEPNAYSVKFDANGGDGAMASQPFVYDAPAALAKCAFTRTGHLFGGWLAGGERFADCATVSNLTAEADGEVVFYADWTPIAYSVAFDANGGSGAMAEMALSYGETATLPRNVFTRTGYSFTGWKAPGAVYGDGAQVSDLASEEGAQVVLSATWRANAYSVRFDANGGEGAMDSASLSYDEAASLPGNSFKRTGYRFAGWATSADASAAYADGAEVSNLAAEDGARVNLFAVWEPVAYSVRFDANGGSGAMADLSMTYGVAAELPPCAFALDGFDFAGWVLDGAQYGDCATVVNLSAEEGGVVVLAAVWKAAADGDGGGGDDQPMEVFPDGAGEIGDFTAETSAAYSGWLRDTETGAIAGLLAVKTTAVKKEGAEARATISVTPFSGRKRTLKTSVAPGGTPTDEFGIIYGNLGLAGEFEGYAVEAARDFAKAKAKTPERALADLMPLGAWTVAFADGDGYSTFAVTVSRKGKAKVAGTLAGGVKFSASAQGILGSDNVFAVPVVNAKKGVGFVLWIGGDGSAAVTDYAVRDWKPVAAAKLLNMADGRHSLSFEMPGWRDYMTETERDGVNVTPLGEETIDVSGGRWKSVKTVGKVSIDKKASPPQTFVKVAATQTPANLAALKLTCAAKTGVVKGSFKLWYVKDGRLKSDKASIAGAVVDGRFFGTATVKKLGSFQMTAE